MTGLLEGDLDAMSAQMVERCLEIGVRDSEGMVNDAMVVGHRIDRRLALYQAETGAGRIEEHHLPVRGGEQVSAAEDLARIGSPVAIAAACGASWRSL